MVWFYYANSKKESAAKRRCQDLTTDTTDLPIRGIRRIRVIRGRAIMRSKKALTAGFASRNVAVMQPTGNPLRVHGQAMNMMALIVQRPSASWIDRGWNPYPDRQEEPN